MSIIALREGDAVTPADRGREFWRGVLLAGGSTALPRWTLNPVPGIREHESTIPDELVAALRRLANKLAVPLSSVLLCDEYLAPRESTGVRLAPTSTTGGNLR